MNIQNFKGDQTELKMGTVAEPVFDLTSLALDEFYAGALECSPLLLMLYDEKRMPFSNKIPRAAFVTFVKEALKQFPSTGTFEAYAFILRAIFGPQIELFFDVPSPGKLTIEINALTDAEFDFIARELVDGVYEFSTMIDDDGATLVFEGIPGIDNVYQLNQIFSEIIPAGIVPNLELTFFTRSDWISEESSIFYNMTDDFDNQIIFYEIGG